MKSFSSSPEFKWRLTQGLQGGGSFSQALQGWVASLDAKAFQQEQTAAQSFSTGLVLLNGLLVALLAITTIQFLSGVLKEGLLW